MSRYTEIPTVAQTLEAVDRWKQRSMVEQRSLFRDDENCWTLAGFEELDQRFVQQPDAGAGGFLEKLQQQLADATPAAKQLALELAWLLYLFPHRSVSAKSKLQSLETIAGLRGDPLPTNHRALRAEVLEGIGSTGTYYNTGFWVEFSYAIYLFKALMALPLTERAALAKPDAALEAWLDGVAFPERLPAGPNLFASRRMFRKIWLYMMQPDRYERVISMANRIQILKALAPRYLEHPADLSSSAHINQQLAEVRKKLEKEFGTTELDYYLEPVLPLWSPAPAVALIDKVQEPAGTYVVPKSPALAAKSAEEALVAKYGPGPRNVIIHGPPGTGKTRELMTHVLPAYVDQPQDETETARLERVTSELGWFDVIAAAMADIGKSVSVPELSAHRFVKARMASAASNSNRLNRLWSNLQSHTVAGCTTVKYDKRIDPLVFDKDAQSLWCIVPGWQGIAPELQEVLDLLQKPTQAVSEVLRRYEMVTFHPSYAYEDFVEGLRPVQVKADDGTESTKIMPVAGPLKRLCRLAQRNPGKRYALVIDEINRGNIAKIFGELITLVEADKRLVLDAQGRIESGIEVHLPYTHEPFGVPPNLDVYGTMNTSDRSIALVDLALRRRFVFRELMPQADVIPGDEDCKGFINADDDGEPIDLRMLLRVINARLTVLRGREATIGHAYLTAVKDIEALRAVFRERIVPLLQEHFFEDWGRIQQVLAVPKDVPAFLESSKPKLTVLFQGRTQDFDDVADAPVWRLAASWPAESFRGLYAGIADDALNLL